MTRWFGLKWFFLCLVCAGLFFSLVAKADTSGTVDVLVTVPGGLAPIINNNKTGFVEQNPQPFLIFDILIKDITTDSATISWQTDQLATSEVFYGESDQYELGVKQGVSFLFKHEIKLINLKPGTTYHFLISSRNLTGATALAGDFVLTTLSLPDHQPPAPITDFQIFPGVEQLTLVWQNPPDPDLAGVRIYRHSRYYPTTQTGELIFTGLASSFLDQPLINGRRYYYTIYSYDWAGNMASGVSQSGVPQGKAAPVLPPPGPEILPPAAGFEEIPPWLFTYAINKTLPLQLSQESEVEALAYDQFRLAIPTKIFPKRLERVIVTIKDSARNAAWLYPLTLTNDGQWWLTDFIVPAQAGAYQVVVDLVFSDQSRAQSHFFIKVYPRGKLNNAWLTSKLIKGGVILLYTWRSEKKEWELWPAFNIWQDNPQVTGLMGEYGFSVPNGRYYLVAHKEGYWTKVLKPFNVTNQRINFKLNLWPIIPFWWAAIVLLLLGSWQYLRKKQYQAVLKKIRQDFRR